MPRQRSCLTSLLLLLALVASSVGHAEEQVLHVAPDGDDTAAGDASSPWATPHRAVRALPAIASRAPDADVRIVLHEGTYRISDPLVVSRQDVPPQGSVTLVAAERAQVVISGGRLVSGWEVTPEGRWQTVIPDVAEGRWRFRELFFNGQRRGRARHPNVGYARIAESFPDKRSGFTFEAGEWPRGWTQGGELVFLHDWSISRIPVARVDHAQRRLTAASPIGSRADHYQIDHFEAHPRYFAENHPAFLDAPGEWLLDEETGVLSCVPMAGESPDQTEIVAPWAEALLVIAGDEGGPVRNVHVQGVQFAHCAWLLPSGGYASGQATAYDLRDESASSRGRTFIPAAIRLERAEACSLTRCRLAHLGTSAIACGARTMSCRFEQNVIEDVAGNGLMLGEDTSRRVENRPWWQAAPEQAAAGHVVSRNRIVQCGAQFFGAVAVWVGLAHDIQITHNEIAHHPYTGVSLGWMWNPTPTPAGGHLVAENHIHHVMQVLSDGGGIYTLGRQPGMQLTGNVIHDVPLNAGRAESNGMFLDEGSDQFEIVDNVIFNIDRSPLRFHKAEELSVRGNTLVVADEETAPLRYNNTRAETISQSANVVLIQRDFDPATVRLPETGPAP